MILLTTGGIGVNIIVNNTTILTARDIFEYQKFNYQSLHSINDSLPIKT